MEFLVIISSLYQLYLASIPGDNITPPRTENLGISICQNFEKYLNPDGEKYARNAKQLGFWVVLCHSANSIGITVVLLHGPRWISAKVEPPHANALLFWMFCVCAKRSFHPCCTSNSDVRPLRKIIDFCEGAQKAASLLLSTGSLSSWFSRIQKWTALKCFKSWYLSVQGPVFGTRLELFLQNVYENNVPPDLAWYGTSWQVFLGLTFSDVATRPAVAGVSWSGYVLVLRTKSVASRPCRARYI